MSDFVLYNYFRSSSSFRIRIIFHLKDIPFEYRPVHLINNGGEQNQQDFRKLNPSGEVPTLVHNNGSAVTTIAQSMAIALYLNDYCVQKKIGSNLLSDNESLRAKIIQFCEIINSGIQPLQNLSVLNYLEKNFNSTTEQKELWTKHWITKGLTSIEKILEQTSNEFCFGKQITLADCFLIPQVFAAKRFNVDIQAFPLISKIDSKCNQLEAFIRAHPSEQIDSPKN